MANKENKAKLREWKQRDQQPAWKIWLIRLILLGILIGVIIVWPRGFVVVVGGLAVFALIIYYWIRYKIKKWWNDSGITGNLFPTDVHIERVRKHKWKELEKIQARTEEFINAGFTELGDYVVEEMPSIKIRAFMKEPERLYGTIYEDCIPRILIDITTTYENGNSLTCTTTPYSGLEQPPMKQLIRLPESASIVELLEKFRENRTDNICLPVSPEEFPERICRSVKEDNEWRMNYYEELNRRDELLVENYLSKTALSGVNWEKTRNRTVFIHKELSKHEMMDHYTRLLSHEDKREYDLKEFRAKKLFEDNERIETFRHLIEDLPDECKPQKVTELNEPLRADVYLFPEEPEDAYEGD